MNRKVYTACLITFTLALAGQTPSRRAPSPSPFPSPNQSPSDLEIVMAMQVLQSQLAEINTRLDQNLKAQDIQAQQQDAYYQDTLQYLRDQIRAQQQVVIEANRRVQTTVAENASDLMIQLRTNLQNESTRLSTMQQQFTAIQNQRASSLQAQESARYEMMAQAQAQRAEIQARLGELQSAAALRN